MNFDEELAKLSGISLSFENIKIDRLEKISLFKKDEERYKLYGKESVVSELESILEKNFGKIEPFISWFKNLEYLINRIPKIKYMSLPILDDDDEARVRLELGDFFDGIDIAVEAQRWFSRFASYKPKVAYEWHKERAVGFFDVSSHLYPASRLIRPFYYDQLRPHIIKKMDRAGEDSEILILEVDRLFLLDIRLHILAMIEQEEHIEYIHSLEDERKLLKLISLTNADYIANKIHPAVLILKTIFSAKDPGKIANVLAQNNDIDFNGLDRFSKWSSRLFSSYSKRENKESLSQTMENLFHIIKNGYKDKLDIEVIDRYKAHKIILNIDEFAFLKILMRLVDNAIDSQATKLSVDAVFTDDGYNKFMRFYISDNGRDFDSTTKKWMFSKFYTTNKKQKGLSLFRSKEEVEKKLKGRMTIEDPKRFVIEIMVSSFE